MKYILVLIGLIIFSACSEDYVTPTNTQLDVIGLDTVFQFLPGEGQNVGQDTVSFPKNIFGMPYLKGTATSGKDVLSLGFGGEITAGFQNYFIIDKQGADFIIFENAFLNPINSKIFAEPGEVSVSKDGINFISFVYDGVTLIGCAGLTPTYGNPKETKNCGGDKFDLSDLGIDSIKYIRIKDITKMIYENKEHPYYDASLTGFDLDAIVGLNFEKIK